MRLVQLRVRNIASLKGEHVIDFSEILRDSSLFAITGETGAGKSTILNCVGLSLYGQIYKKNVTQLDVVTLGEKEGSIELIFQTKGTHYLAEWKARVKKQNGESYATPQPALRTLYKIDGQDFNSKREVAGQSAAELLNLTFDQFCKCIILNQGEFAKFLTSTFNDRKDILEKLYPGEELENMGRELRIELEALKQEKNDTEIKLGELPSDPTAGEKLEEEQKKLEVLLKRFDAELKTIEELERHFSSLLTYYDKFQDGVSKKNQLTKDVAVETTRFNSLLKSGEEIHARAEKARKNQEQELPGLQELLKQEESLKNLTESKERLKKTLEGLALDLSNLNHKKEQKLKEQSEIAEKLLDLEKMFSLPIEALKKTRDYHSRLFDLFSEKELIDQEIRGKKEALVKIEDDGRVLRTTYDLVEKELSEFPPDLNKLAASCEEKKLKNNSNLLIKNKAQIRREELQKQTAMLNEEQKQNQEKLTELDGLKNKLREEILPLESLLLLQDLLQASSVCANHAIANNLTECPVCDSALTTERLHKMQEKFQHSDLQGTQKKFIELNERLQATTREESLTMEKLKREAERLSGIESEMNLLKKDLGLEVIPAELIDQELLLLKKSIWRHDGLQVDFQNKKIELEKIRAKFQSQKKEIDALGDILTEKSERLSEISTVFRPLFAEITKDTIRELKGETSNLYLYLDLENKAQVLQGELGQMETLERNLRDNKNLLATEGETLATRMQKISSELSEALKGKKASDLIQELNKELKLSHEESLKQLEHERRQEGVLKDIQGRLGQLEELLKDFDLQFVKELHLLKDLARGLEIPSLGFLKELQLTLTTERELYLPIKDLLSKEREELRERTNQGRMNLATVKANLLEWEKVQDKIGLLTLKLKELNAELHRKERLFEVLGKDELRTFVLALVEESLILQTNEELQKLCQGRYEIVHQTKSLRMTPEFYILDKYREGGRRKVSTLSGGETFMVSLAMALGLAEMTRGQAEIDSLFIDEGFGTLDQDSLEDVLNMLQQIQTRGLMVGIISHIKTLTGSIPVNLNLRKKNDGTSSIEVVHN